MFSENRTEYLKMIASAERMEIDVVVVMKLDRLARDLADAATAIKFLKSNRCTLLAGDDVNNADTAEGEFMRSILLAQNQFHARRVASDVIKTDCNIAKQGKTVGGVAPYGLKTVDRHYYIDESEAPAIRLMFQGIADGKSYQSVIKELTESGYRTRNGEKFSYSSLNALLRNEKYCGTYIYNREGGKKKKDRVLLEHVDEVRIDEHIEPIIDKTLFDRVQSILDKRKNECRPHMDASNYLLTGKLFCKECGGPMSGVSSTASGRGKRKYRNYCCPKHHKRYGGTCPTKNINADYLESAVKFILTESVNGYLHDTFAAEQILSCLNAPLHKERAELSRRVFDLNGQIDKFLSRAASTPNTILMQRYEDKASEYAKTQEKLKEKIAEIDSQIAATKAMTSDMVGGKPFTVEELFASDEDARLLIDLFVERIEIDETGDEIQIIFCQ